MPEETITISKKELECLRKHLNSAIALMHGLGFSVGDENSPSKTTEKISFKEGVDNYKKLLGSGAKRQLPIHLKQKAH